MARPKFLYYGGRRNRKLRRRREGYTFRYPSAARSGPGLELALPVLGACMI
jgi:hypothetical protein